MNALQDLSLRGVFNGLYYRGRGFDQVDLAHCDISDDTHGLDRLAVHIGGGSVHLSEIFLT